MCQGPAVKRKNGGTIAMASQIWGFPHLYYPSNPDFAAGWLAACEAFGERPGNRGADTMTGKEDRNL